MMSEPITLYKLMILHMLNRVNFPLTSAQFSDFFLTREYTNFFSLQQALSELGGRTDPQLLRPKDFPGDPAGYR